MAGREFDSAEEADDWLSYAIMQKNQDIQMMTFGVSIRFGLVNYLMPECSCAHFTVHASGEIFLALNGLSVTVQTSK